MCYCVICGKPSERHHIVYKNQGGFDIPCNYVELCPYHHREEVGPHKNREVDLLYKKKMQDYLMEMLNKDYYTIEEIIDKIKINPFQAKSLKIKLNKYKKGYKRIEIIRTIMGGKLY